MRRQPKLLHEISLMSYDDAKSEHDFLEEQVAVTGEVLRAFPRNAVGLVSESIRLSPEYRTAKSRGDAAFKTLQKFNQVFEVFAKELRAERAARYKR